MSEREAILVIDDDEGVRELLRDFFESQRYVVAVAGTGAEGLRKIREGDFGLVLLDLVLPDLRGTAVMRQALDPRPAWPPEFIIVTGHATLATAVEAVEGSAVGYIQKPLDLERLRAIARRVFDRRRFLREHASLQQELAARLEQSEGLLDVSRAVGSTLDLREALRQVCRALARLLGADTVAAYLHDAPTDQLVPTAAYRVPKEHLATLASAPIPLREQGFHASVWAERHPVYSDDVVHDPRFTHRMFRDIPHQSGLLLPLLTDAEVGGAFYAVWWTARRHFEEGELRTLTGICEQVGVLLRNARLYEQAERTRHRLEVMNDVSRRLAAVHDPDDVLSTIVNQAARLVGAEAAGLRLLEGDELVVSARTESAAALMSRPRLRVGESLSGLVVAGGAPIVVEDLSADTRHEPAHKRAALEQGFLGFIGVPLQSAGRVIGTLNVYTKGARHFLSDEVTLLSALADHAATAIEKARLFRAAEEGRRLLDRLYQATISMQGSQDRGDRLQAFVHAAREVVGFDRVNVFLLTPDGSALELVTAAGSERAPELTLPCGPGAGAFYQALESRRPVVVLGDADLARLTPLAGSSGAHPYLRTRRFVVVPLVVGARVIGVVSADNKPSRRPIRPSSIEPFGTLCQNLAIALEESRLYAETRAREEETRKLYEVTRELATSLDRERLLDLIASQTMELTGCQASGIYVYDRERDGLVFRRGLNLDPELTRTLVLRPGEGVGGRAFLERRAVWTRDRLADSALQYTTSARTLIETRAPRAYLAVPIVSRDEIYGVLMEYFFGPHDFSLREIQLVSTLADHAALALENARLYEQTQAQQVRLAQIFDSTSDGIVLVGRGGEIQAANRQAGDLLGFDADAAVGLTLAGLLAEHRSSMPDDDGVLGSIAGLLRAPDRGGEGDLELRRTSQVIHWTGQPTKAAGGATMGLTLTLRDVTQERQVAQMKTDFVSFVTHQLRTPLSGIKWMLELAGQEAEVPEALASYIQDARQAAERLIGLVNDLLDISRLESGKLKVESVPVQLGQLTRSVLDDLVTLVHERGHRLTIDGADAIPAIMADPQLLRQVVVNLLSNAIKYTPAGGAITIRMGVEDGAVRWAVSDSGIGIPTASKARLCEKFYRAENVQAIETEGTGLGLYLVRLILERLSGRVWCESEAGQGSTFIFTLPASGRGQ